MYVMSLRGSVLERTRASSCWSIIVSAFNVFEHLAKKGKTGGVLKTLPGSLTFEAMSRMAKASGHSNKGWLSTHQKNPRVRKIVCP